MDKQFLLNLNPYVIFCFHNATSLQFDKGFKYKPRITSAYELEYVNFGKSEMSLNGKTFGIQEGDIIFKQPGTLVQGVAKYSSVIICFTPFYDPLLEQLDYPDTLENNFKKIDYDPRFILPDLYHPLNNSDLNVLFFSTYKSFLHKTKFHQLHTKTNVLRIITMLTEDMSAKPINKNDTRLKYHDEIMQAEKYIRENCRLKLYTPDIAAMFNMSVGFFNKLFKKYLKQTPIEYQNNCRLEKARELLIHTSKTVKQISLDCGFNSDTYFETLFTKIEGRTPTRYRREPKKATDRMA